MFPKLGNFFIRPFGRVTSCNSVASNGWKTHKVEEGGGLVKNQTGEIAYCRLTGGWVMGEESLRYAPFVGAGSSRDDPVRGLRRPINPQQDVPKNFSPPASLEEYPRNSESAKKIKRLLCAFCASARETFTGFIPRFQVRVPSMREGSRNA